MVKTEEKLAKKSIEKKNNAFCEIESWEYENSGLFFNNHVCTDLTGNVKVGSLLLVRFIN